MTFQNILRHRKVYLVMAIWMFLLSSAPQNAFSMTVDSYSYLKDNLRQQDINKIKEFLSRELVAKKLSQLGLSAEQVNQRLDTLSDREIRLLASRLETVKAGGDATGFVIGVLILVIVVLIILYITDYQVKIEKKHTK